MRDSSVTLNGVQHVSTGQRIRILVCRNWEAKPATQTSFSLSSDVIRETSIWNSLSSFLLFFPTPVTNHSRTFRLWPKFRAGIPDHWHQHVTTGVSDVLADSPLWLRSQNGPPTSQWPRLVRSLLHQVPVCKLHDRVRHSMSILLDLS